MTSSLSSSAADIQVERPSTVDVRRAVLAVATTVDVRRVQISDGDADAGRVGSWVADRVANAPLAALDRELLGVLVAVALPTPDTMPLGLSLRGSHGFR